MLITYNMYLITVIHVTIKTPIGWLEVFFQFLNYDFNVM